jgi:hypothetical protein
LSDLAVLTEGAPNYYGTAPVIAAVARAKKVYALVKNPTDRSVAQRYAERLCQMADRRCKIEVVAAKRAEIVSEADIVTNTAPVRPIDARMVSIMKNTAVVMVPLMYERWERRSEDVDVDACKRRGIVVIGTDETKAGVFKYIGVMAIRQLLDVKIEIAGCRIIVRATNKFGSYVMRTLSSLGARVFGVCSLSRVTQTGARKAGTSLRDAIARRFLAGADALVVVINPEGVRLRERCFIISLPGSPSLNSQG